MIKHCEKYLFCADGAELQIRVVKRNVSWSNGAV